MLKRLLQRWLGIQELSDMLVLQKKRLDYKENRSGNDKWPEKKLSDLPQSSEDSIGHFDIEPTIRKGYAKVR